MNKEEKKFIERIENTFYENRGKGIKHFQKVTLYEEGITDILKLLNFVKKQQKKLEQKESILDKVTEFIKDDVTAEDIRFEGSKLFSTVYKSLISKTKEKIAECINSYKDEIEDIIEGEKK